MDHFKNILDLKQNKVSNRTLIIYMFIAYFFSVGVRLFLYYQISDNNEYFYNGNVIPLWTPDAGLYGYYANQLLSGVSYPFISEYMPGYLLYGIVSITGLNIDTVLFFAPAFLSSLIVVPMLLIANHYSLARYGLYAALIGSLMTSYYYRTHLGYYDTDVLNVVFPLLSIYFLIRTVDTKKSIYALYASINLLAFSVWYHSSLPIIFSIVGIYLLYVLIFERKAAYAYQSLFIVAIVLLPLTLMYKIGLLIIIPLLFYAVHKYKDIHYKYYLSLFVVAIVAFLVLVDTSKYYERVDNYVNKTAAIEVKSSEGTLKLKSDLDTVFEAKGITFHENIKWVSGTIPFFILAVLGYIALLIRYRSMLLTLPLVLLTFIAMVAGSRFVIYGVMLFSFAMVYGVHLVFRSIFTVWGNFSEKISNITSKLFLVIVLLFTLNTIVNYNKIIFPLLFSSTEDVEPLYKLKENVKKGDFILTWWDYGWPLWYYTGLKTLIDNGKHQQDNFIVSKILLSDNETFAKNASIYFVEKYKEGRRKGFKRVMNYFSHNHSISYLKEMENKAFKLPSSNRDIYILLHKRMLTTLSTIEVFSNIDLKTGKNYKSGVLGMGYLNKKYDKSQTLLKSKDFTIDLQKGELLLKSGSMKIRKLAITGSYKMKLEKSYPYFSNLNILIGNGVVLMMTSKLYNSFLVQALLFNNYNRDDFTEISRTKNFLILKVNNKKSK